MPEWKDTTSYSRDDKEKIPTTFSLLLGGMRVTITSGHINDRGNWRIIFRPFTEGFFLNKRVEDYTPEAIQEIAFNYAKDKLANVNEALADFTTGEIMADTRPFSRHGEDVFILSRAVFLYGPTGNFNEKRNKLLAGNDGDIILRSQPEAYVDNQDAVKILTHLNLLRN